MRGPKDVMPPRPRAAPLARWSVPFPAQSVPFPAELLDRAMPALTDTEWRLLCVVVRQTLGWRDKQTGGRKQKDWLTQSQLTARTGRTTKPVAQAISSLTAKQLIQVVSDGGEALLTPDQRRRHAGRHWFQLHPRWNSAWAVRASGQGNATASSNAHRKDGPSGETPGETPNGGSPHEKGGQGEPTVNRRGVAHHPGLLAEAHRVFSAEKVHTTKENDYKYNYKYSHERYHAGRQGGFLHSVPSGSSQRTSAPMQSAGSVQNNQHGRNRLDRHTGEMTAYSSQTVLLHTIWDREAAGNRWRWHKDLARWITCEVNEKEKNVVGDKATETSK